LTGSETTLASGWYLASGALKYSETLTAAGDVHLILANGCNLTVNGSSDGAGIDVSAGNSLTIYAPSTGSSMGRLTATGGGAGMGGNTSESTGGAGGAITINGGAVTANGGSGSAGIGGGGSYSTIGSLPGTGGDGGTITINGGTVIATGGGNGSAGIGGGAGIIGQVNSGAAGTIVISNGTVTANGGSGGEGIGGGGGGNITISGGTVTANSSYGTGIGGSSVTISGGTVTATGSVGISGGSASGNVLIYGENTRVTAKGGGSGAQDIDTGAPGTVFVALPQSNLTLSTPPTTTANAVLFMADTASTGTVTMALPAPFSATDNLLTGLNTTGKTLTIITTLGAGTVSFALEGYGNSPITETGIDLMTPSAKVAFAKAGSPPPTPVMLTPQAVTGDWYDPAYDGSGFNLLMTGSGLVLYYYGWDSYGNRLWLISDIGPTQIASGASFMLNMNQTNYGTFLTPAPPSTATQWGTLTLNFSVDGATAIATLSGPDGRVNLNVQKIVGTTSTASVTGDWYDPAYNGSGVNLLMTGAGLTLYDYGWDSVGFGNPLWLVSDIGPTQIAPGTLITLNMHETNGGFFLTPALPSTSTVWGTLQLNFSSCTQATAILSGNDGSVNLSNLLMITGVLNLPPGC
jgi:hypothetical protein